MKGFCETPTALYARLLMVSKFDVFPSLDSEAFEARHQPRYGGQSPGFSRSLAVQRASMMLCGDP